MKKISMSFIDIQKTGGDKAAIDFATRVGAFGIDFDLSHLSVKKKDSLYTEGEGAVISYMEELKKYADSNGIVIRQVHGRPHVWSSDEAGNRNFVRDTELDCLAAGVLGAKYCVVHTPSINLLGGDHSDEEYFASNMEMLRSIIPFAKANKIKIALETHGYSRKLEKVEFFGFIDNLKEACIRAIRELDCADALCVCVDTGHTNMTVRHGEASVGDAIRKLGSLVEVLHIHDNNGILDEHKIPGTGIIDFEDVFAALKEIGFKGWYNLENSLTHFGGDFEHEEASFSIKVLEHYLTKAIINYEA